MSKKPRGEAHVRLYRHELECPAYRSLSTDARALLVEFRALYTGRENRIPMSVREIMRRLGVGQRRAQRARDELKDRGFIRELVSGGFSRNDRKATVYALTNEPLTDRDGATAPKDFMSWTPQKSIVAEMTTDCSQIEYSEGKESPPNGSHGSQIEYRKPVNQASHGSHSGYTDRLPGREGDYSPGLPQWTSLLQMGVEK